MKQLLRSFRLHDGQYILHALDRLFAYRGRNYKPYRRTVASPFANTVVKYRDSGLNQWISLAAQNLCAGARKRIRAEITAHWKDALTALMEAGLSREKAETRILEELGNPLQANAAFQRTYLTSAQERYMARLCNPGPTHFQTLGGAMVCACIGALLESISALARSLGWFENSFYISFFSDIFPAFLTPIFLFQTRFKNSFKRTFWLANPHDIEKTRKWECRFKELLDHTGPWLLFALFACLYALMEVQMRRYGYLFCCMFTVVLPLYGAVHRGIIRDIVAFIPHVPRTRTCLMLGYSGALFGLMLAAIPFFRWIAQLGWNEYEQHLTLHSEAAVGLIYQAIPAVVALLWFACHALMGAFFVSKCNAPQTTHVEREPQEEDPA